MKSSASIIGIVAVFVAAYAAAGKPVADNEMGLSKTSVFEDPSPEVFQYPETKPAAAKALPVAWDGAPPQVPHDITAFLPIKPDANACLDCHDKPSLLEKLIKEMPKPVPEMMRKIVKGGPTPMPVSHYNRSEGRLEFNNALYLCNQCHVPQANVGELVGNSFKGQ
jgi:cytochrome c-type protein NapB